MAATRPRGSRCPQNTGRTPAKTDRASAGRGLAQGRAVRQLVPVRRLAARNRNQPRALARPSKQLSTFTLRCPDPASASAAAIVLLLLLLFAAATHSSYSATLQSQSSMPKAVGLSGGGVAFHRHQQIPPRATDFDPADEQKGEQMLRTPPRCATRPDIFLACSASRPGDVAVVVVVVVS